MVAMQDWQDQAILADTNTANLTNHFNKIVLGRLATMACQAMRIQLCGAGLKWVRHQSFNTKWRLLANRYIILLSTRRPFIRIYKRNIKVKGIK